MNIYINSLLIDKQTCSHPFFMLPCNPGFGIILF